MVIIGEPALYFAELFEYDWTGEPIGVENREKRKELLAAAFLTVLLAAVYYRRAARV